VLVCQIGIRFKKMSIAYPNTFMCINWVQLFRRR